MIVGIEYRALILGMTCNMNLSDPLMGNASHVIKRIEVMVLRRNVNIVDVKQDADNLRVRRLQ